MSFYITRTVNKSFDPVSTKLKELLHEHQYLVAADIDVQGALKQKLDADLPQIRIIGTNTPSVGYQLFSTDPKLGTLLPFSIVLHEINKETTEITMIDPEWLFSAVDDTSILELATEVKSTFKEIIESI